MNFYAESFVQQAQASLAQGLLTGLAENRVAFVARYAGWSTPAPW
jgi:NAD(P)H dehydrogenase (quinone)